MQYNLNQPLNPPQNQPAYGAPPQYGQPTYGAPPQNYGQPAYGAPQNPAYQPNHNGLPPHQVQNFENQPPAANGVRNALILDLVLSLLNVLFYLNGAARGAYGTNSSQTLWLPFGINIGWLTMVIVAFNSGYTQHPIKNAGFLACYKIFRLIIYWIITIGYGISAGLCLIFGISLVSAKPTPGEGGHIAGAIGIFLLICVPFLLIFVGLGVMGLKGNKHFDRLLEDDNALPQRML